MEPRPRGGHRLAAAALVRETTEGAERIATIVRADLKVSRAASREVRLMPVDAPRGGAGVQDGGQRHSPRARLVTEFEPVAPVEASESRLCQVFLNLLNARRRRFRGRRILADIRRHSSSGDRGRCWWRRVRDTGMGMTPEVMDRIFLDPFTTRRWAWGRGAGAVHLPPRHHRVHGRLHPRGERAGRGSTHAVLREARESEVLPRLQSVVQVNARARISSHDEPT